MSFLNDIKTRQIQKKGNAFIKSLNNKTDTEAKQMYLDNKEFHNNEIVLSYIFFNFPSLISLLPVDFQKSMINSNIPMFKHGSDEAKKSLVSDWLSDNKFFMNIKQIDLDTEEYENYICMYFNQVEDVSKLFMNDLYTVINILYKHDKRMTENVIETIKDKLSEKQWEFILKVDPMFIKYAKDDIQNIYSEKEDFSKYISGSAKDNYIKKQLEKIKEDKSLLKSMNIDVQREYIISHPYAFNLFEDSEIIELLKYDAKLLKYVPVEKLSNEVIYEVLENASNKSINEIIDIFINKCLFNAKSKLFRYDIISNNLKYQYTKRLIRIISSLELEKIISLIDIDINYCLPYIVPLYNEKDDREYKKSEALEANSRCLNLFRSYYNDEIYNKYYKVINKIYNEFIVNIDKYNYDKDYQCIFDLFKILFNKRIISNNKSEKISIFIGISLLYKGKENNDSSKTSIKLLNELLSNAYNKKININKTIYDINTLEMFDDRLSFINNNILMNNNIDLSTLLYIIKSNNIDLFKEYYYILTNIYGESADTLIFALENYNYYIDILEDVNNKELNDEEIDNLIRLLISSKNLLNINKKDELMSYDLTLLKKLISDFSENEDEIIHKNLVCNYFFNKPYNSFGNNNQYISTIKNWCDICETEVLKEIDDFIPEEIELFSVIKMMCSTDNSELLISFIENIMNDTNSNVLPIVNLFNKLEKNKILIINKQVVTLDDVKLLYNSNSGSVFLNNDRGVDIYTFKNQDFKVLSSFSNDGLHYDICYISDLDNNSFGYNSLTGDEFRISTFENKTLIKKRKDSKILIKDEPDFMIVRKELTDDIINTARERGICIIRWGETYE